MSLIFVSACLNLPTFFIQLMSLMCSQKTQIEIFRQFFFCSFSLEQILLLLCLWVFDSFHIHGYGYEDKVQKGDHINNISVLNLRGIKKDKDVSIFLLVAKINWMKRRKGSIIFFTSSFS